MILVFVEPEGDELAVLSQEALTFARATAAATGSGDTPIHAVAADPLSPRALDSLAAQGVSVQLSHLRINHTRCSRPDSVRAT